MKNTTQLLNERSVLWVTKVSVPINIIIITTAIGTLPLALKLWLLENVARACARDILFPLSSCALDKYPSGAGTCDPPHFFRHA